MTTVSQKMNFRIVTLVSLGIMLAIMLFVNKDFGVTGDETTQNFYGEKVLNYYLTGGDDKSSLNYLNVYYYGGFYDMLCAAVNKIVPFDPFNTRHFINAIFGFLTILFSVLLAKFYKGWGAALLTAWLLFLSPRFFGESMNNPKDIPFALGMVMGIYFIVRFLRAFPKPTIKDALWLALAIGYTIGIRVGGLLLIPFLFVGLGLKYFFEWRHQYSLASKDVKQTTIKAIALSIVGYFLGLIFWPYALQAPLSNPFNALSEMSQFSTGIRMLFDDQHIMSTQVPWYYIPKYISITTPIIILAAIFLSPILFFDKRYKRNDIFFLFFVTLFPLLYIIYKESPLYDGWRHLLFIYPPLVVLASLGVFSLINIIGNKIATYTVAGVLIIGLFFPVKWMFANHPNQIVYFNQLVGGVDGAYGYYETDYYMNSIKEATYELVEKENLRNTDDTVYIATNCINPLGQYLVEIGNPKLVPIYVRYYQRYDQNWDYGIFFSRFIDKSLLQNGYFPPHNTILTVDAENTPLTAVVKRGKERYEVMAADYYAKQDYASAATYYQKAIEQNPKNETAYLPLGVSLASIGQIDPAINAINQSLNMNPNDITAYQILAQLYLAKGDQQNAQMASSRASVLIMEMQEQ